MSTVFEPQFSLSDRFIPSREVKRRGIRALDEKLKEGPVFIVSNDEPKYVVMTEAFYRELLEEADEASFYRVQESLEDIPAGRVRETTVEKILEKFRPEGERETRK